MKPLKLYLETSVWNFYFADDAPEKKEITIDFFTNAKENQFELYISDEVLREINQADPEKAEKLIGLIAEFQPRLIEVNTESRALAMKYLDAKILPEKTTADALHAALATVHELDALLSWNMKHLANYRRMQSINAINLLNGYTKHLDLLTPMEVSQNED